MDFSAFLLPLLVAAAGQVPPFPSRDSTGIEGLVYTVSGNRMPSPDKPAAGSGRRGIRSTVYIFELTNTSQVVQQSNPRGQSPCFTAVNSKLVRQVNTDETGRFLALVPPGRYSVFTKKGDLFCAGRRDEQNNIAPVDVLPGKMTRVDCRVETDHAAVY